MPIQVSSHGGEELGRGGTRTLAPLREVSKGKPQPPNQRPYMNMGKRCEEKEEA